MARVSKEQAARNKLAIAEASARLFREHGLNGVSVAELMASVGLTHGGFYGHFESKDELAGLACARAFEQRALHWQERLAAHGPSAELFAEMVGAYLSPRHRDNPGAGCTAVALAGDMARGDVGEPARTAFLAGIKRMATTLQALPGGPQTDAGRTRALTQLATLVGAVTLARATRGDALSDEILSAALLALLPGEADHG